jgi:hypothetical protein
MTSNNTQYPRCRDRQEVRREAHMFTTHSQAYHLCLQPIARIPPAARRPAGSRSHRACEPDPARGRRTFLLWEADPIDGEAGGGDQFIGGAT